MTDQRLTFGEMTVFGELARGVHPADELGLQMAMALGRPDPPCPPFATLPVMLDGHRIGQISSIKFTWGATCYEFESVTRKTKFSCPTKEEVVLYLMGVLGLTG